MGLTCVEKAHFGLLLVDPGSPPRGTHWTLSDPDSDDEEALPPLASTELSAVETPRVIDSTDAAEPAALKSQSLIRKVRSLTNLRKSSGAYDETSSNDPPEQELPDDFSKTVKTMGREWIQRIKSSSTISQSTETERSESLFKMLAKKKIKTNLEMLDRLPSAASEKTLPPVPDRPKGRTRVWFEGDETTSTDSPTKDEAQAMIDCRLAPPRKSAMEGIRDWQLSKALAKKTGDESNVLSAPNLEWKWTENYRGFLILPKSRNGAKITATRRRASSDPERGPDLTAAEKRRSLILLDVDLGQRLPFFRPGFSFPSDFPEATESSVPLGKNEEPLHALTSDEQISDKVTSAKPTSDKPTTDNPTSDGPPSHEPPPNEPPQHNAEPAAFPKISGSKSHKRVLFLDDAINEQKWKDDEKLREAMCASLLQKDGKVYPYRSASDAPLKSPTPKFPKDRATSATAMMQDDPLSTVNRLESPSLGPARTLHRKKGVVFVQTSPAPLGPPPPRPPRPDSQGTEDLLSRQLFAPLDVRGERPLRKKELDNKVARAEQIQLYEMRKKEEEDEANMAAARASVDDNMSMTKRDFSGPITRASMDNVAANRGEFPALMTPRQTPLSNQTSTALKMAKTSPPIITAKYSLFPKVQPRLPIDPDVKKSSFEESKSKAPRTAKDITQRVLETATGVGGVLLPSLSKESGSSTGRGSLGRRRGSSVSQDPSATSRSPHHRQDGGSEQSSPGSSATILPQDSISVRHGEGVLSPPVIDPMPAPLNIVKKRSQLAEMTETTPPGTFPKEVSKPAPQPWNPFEEDEKKAAVRGSSWMSGGRKDAKRHREERDVKFKEQARLELRVDGFSQQRAELPRKAKSQRDLKEGSRQSFAHSEHTVLGALDFLASTAPPGTPPAAGQPPPSRLPRRVPSIPVRPASPGGPAALEVQHRLRSKLSLNIFKRKDRPVDGDGKEAFGEGKKDDGKKGKTG
jgi:hypothetical protein